MSRGRGHKQTSFDGCSIIIIKFILKCIALPLLLPIVLIQWIGIFLNSMSSVIFGMLSGICALTAIASLAFGLSIGGEVIRMLIIAFVIFIIPHIGNWIIERIVMVRCLLKEFIRS